MQKWKDSRETLTFWALTWHLRILEVTTANEPFPEHWLECEHVNLAAKRNANKTSCPDCGLGVKFEFVQDPEQCNECGELTTTEEEMPCGWMYQCDCFAECVLDEPWNPDLLNLVFCDEAWNYLCRLISLAKTTMAKREPKAQAEVEP